MNTEYINKARFIFSRKFAELSADQVEDFIQDACLLVELTAPLDVRTDETRWLGYVLGCARNLYRNHLKHRKRVVSLDALRGDGFDPSQESQPAKDLMNADTVQALLSEIDPIDAEIIRLKWIQGLTLTETARKLGLTTTAVEKRHERAFKKLQNLAKAGGGGINISENSLSTRVDFWSSRYTLLYGHPNDRMQREK